MYAIRSYYVTDRDGKMQLESLAQSGFDPLSRTCRFMLTEEAHHMFVGETGISRTVQRTCEAMVSAGIDDPTDIHEAERFTELVNRACYNSQRMQARNDI